MNGENPYKSTKLHWQNFVIFMFLRWSLYFKFFLRHLLFYLYKLGSYFACDWVKAHLQKWLICVCVCVDFILKVLFPAFTEAWVGVCGDGSFSCGCPMVPSSGSQEYKQFHHTYRDHSPQLLLCNRLGRTQKLKQAVWLPASAPNRLIWWHFNQLSYMWINRGLLDNPFPPFPSSEANRRSL